MRFANEMSACIRTQPEAACTAIQCTAEKKLRPDVSSQETRFRNTDAVFKTSFAWHHTVQRPQQVQHL